jgi:hypothetical protein
MRGNSPGSVATASLNSKFFGSMGLFFWSIPIVASLSKRAVKQTRRLRQTDPTGDKS